MAGGDIGLHILFVRYPRRFMGYGCESWTNKTEN